MPETATEQTPEQSAEKPAEKAKELSLYIVVGRSYDRMLNRLYNRGDDHGEARDFSPMVVVATSSQAAIDNLWNSMNERCDKHFETADRIIAEVERLKTESKFAEAAQREREATKPGGELGQSVPDEPKDKERWRSWKIFVPKGYRIIRDPDAKAAPIIVDPATQG